MAELTLWRFPTSAKLRRSAKDTDMNGLQPYTKLTVHSHRSACCGSTRDARQAGRAAAIIAGESDSDTSTSEPFAFSTRLVETAVSPENVTERPFQSKR